MRRTASAGTLPDSGADGAPVAGSRNTRHPADPAEEAASGCAAIPDESAPSVVSVSAKAKADHRVMLLLEVHAHETQCARDVAQLVREAFNLRRPIARQGNVRPVDVAKE